uniref:hypothetical protein n=1 Tax=uncultured Sphingomonas sp. TaxID=158754 RepID=UPI0035CC1EF1
MTRRSRILPLALALMSATPAFAAALVVTKTSQVVSDPQGDVGPKAVPGAEVDYTISIQNPNSVATTIAGVTFTDSIPANTKLRVTDYGLLNSGPVSFSSGLSLLTYAFTNFADDADSLSFSNDNGVTWKYRPVADATGCDANVNKIRVVAGGSQLFGTTFSIKFRVRVK